MSSLVFNTTRSIICEPGCIEKLGQITKNQIGTRVMLVTDPCLLDIGLVDGAIESLAQVGVEFEIFSDVVADPPAKVVELACQKARKAKIEGVIGLGGGSSMDVAKLVALLVGGGGKPQ